MTLLSKPATKKALTEAVRLIVNAAEFDTPLQGPDLSFIVEILTSHPDWEEKKGSGVRSIVVRENRAFGFRPTRGLWLIRTDGSEVDISWTEAISPTPHHRKVKAVMRNLVAEQSASYRRRFISQHCDEEESYPCEACGLPLKDDLKPEVDHRPPQEFDSLVTHFLNERKLLFSDMALCKHGEQDLGDKLKEEKLAADWQEWHRERASLWLVCVPCHKRLTAERKGKEADGNNP